MWAGVECTINRLEGEIYPDQLDMSGHYERPEDIGLFASLGVSRIRYPVLWERVAPRHPEERDFRFADERLARLREAGVAPIVGLTHHGGGPRYTSLLDPRFPELLAEHAAATAQRYPWVDAYTPVNEPNTTARFSALYGHWYPHLRDEAAYITVLVNEVRATALAMAAVREVNPAALLVATDDLGRIHGTEHMQYQVDYENERRFLGWDMMLGRLKPGHPLWDHIAGLAGVDLEALLRLAEEPVVPDVIGVNHYLTSERFLDEDLARYPEECHGGNGCEPYADTELVWVDGGRRVGAYGVLREAWERYGLPLAITEAHLSGYREEQMQWLVEVYSDACRLAEEGADVRAVTAWSLLGSFDWNELVTQIRGYYESGVFDVRSGQPRETALAHVVRALARGEAPSDSVLSTLGWWHRPERVRYQPSEGAPGLELPLGEASRLTVATPSRPPLLITGASGTLGSAFVRACERRSIECRPIPHTELDVGNAESVERLIERERPWAIVNAAGYVRVDDAEREPGLCERANAWGPSVLARVCAEKNVQLVVFSSDLVFDGRRESPYLESAPTRPLCVYGRSKELMEQLVARVMPSALIVRTSAFFGPWDTANFVYQVLRALRRNAPLRVPADLVVSPTYIPNLVDVTLDLLIDRESGVWHLANQSACSWYDFGKKVAQAAGLPTRKLLRAREGEMGYSAPRPAYSALSSERGDLMPELDEAIEQYLRECAFA